VVTPPWLFAAAALPLVALLALAWRHVGGLRRPFEPSPVAARVLAWAVEHHHHVRREGRVVEVVGVLGDRRFTVATHPGPPEVVLLAVDCDAELPDDTAVLAVQDGALVSRITTPEPEQLADLDGLLHSLADMAAGVEAQACYRGPCP
jgi:hypothetical protein